MTHNQRIKIARQMIREHERAARLFIRSGQYDLAIQRLIWAERKAGFVDGLTTADDRIP